MTNLRRNRKAQGFTLIELMITVGLIGVLSAIAIPNFVRWQAKARRSEAMANLSAIGRAEKGLFAENNGFFDSGNAFPDAGMYGGLGTSRMPWDAASQTAFRDLGWTPEGQVYYSYGVYIPIAAGGVGTGCACTLCFTAAAYGDADGNGSTTGVLYVHPDETGGACSEELFSWGAPVDPASGLTVTDAPGARSNSDY